MDSKPLSATVPAGPTCDTVTNPSTGVALRTTSESTKPAETPLGALQTVDAAPVGAPSKTEVPTLLPTRRLITCSTTTPPSSMRSFVEITIP